MSADALPPPLSPTISILRDAAGVITHVDEAVIEVLGWRPEQLIGRASSTLVHSEDQPSAIAAWVEMITTPGATGVWRGRYQSADGAWVWVETANVNRLEDEANPVVQTSMTRVTVDQVSVEEELRARKELLSRLSDALPVGLFQIDLERHITFTNDRLHAIIGVLPAATVDGQFTTVVEEDRPVLDETLSAVLADHPIDDIELRVRLPRGEASSTADLERVCVLSLRPLTDALGVVTGAIGCLSDATDRVQLRRELEFRASVDQLTSCMNRSATLELLEVSLTDPRSADHGMAVVFVDLDGFKSVNDMLGHAAGDRLLVIAADRLRGVVRGNDRLGRIGGDEFLVICPGVENEEKALDIGTRIADALNTTVDIDGGLVDLRGSVGVAWTSEPIDADSFIAEADRAMYESKRAGLGAVSIVAGAHHAGR